MLFPAGFRRGRGACGRVAALTAFVEGGFRRSLGTGAVFLDLTAACGAVWRTGLLCRLSEGVPCWFARLVGLLLRDRRFGVRVGGGAGSWGPRRGGLPRGSVLAPILFSLCSSGLPVARGRGFVYADGVCLAVRGQCFGELGCGLSSDVARMSRFCRRWRLGPGASGAVSSAFHLRGTSAARGLSVYLDGLRLRHECHPTCLGVALGRAMSCGEHLTKTAGKLKNRNNLLMK